jgi:uroporphyrinogen-III synthase
MALDALEGFTVGVTADRRWDQQADLLRRRGATVMHGPALATNYLADPAALLAATEEVAGGIDATVVTTGVGVRAWFEAAEVSGQAERLRAAIRASRILCRGPKAAAALRVAGVETEPTDQSESLAELVGHGTGAGLAGMKVAFQHHGTADGSWVGRLRESGARVVEVPVYQWEQPGRPDAALRLIQAACAGKLDAITFTSAPAAANLVGLAESHGLHDGLLEMCNEGRVVVACVGPVCAAGAADVGLTNTVAPSVGRLGLLVKVLTDALASKRRDWSANGIEAVLQGRALVLGEERFLLSDGEARFLDALAERPGVVLGRETLARRLQSTPRAVEAALGRLRRRTAPSGGDLVQTVSSRGYRLPVS